MGIPPNLGTQNRGSIYIYFDINIGDPAGFNQFFSEQKASEKLRFQCFPYCSPLIIHNMLSELPAPTSFPASQP